ncbi:MAG: DUF5686 and carboxypeptidase regulatory-like domain-containing protein [Prevotellaceae bacterium]|jgi:hypothetical protein|nr:DUF5686 and carboxypeptidase regulatory-like domain-containing protein [Prevotellaceae bacterium]
MLFVFVLKMAAQDIIVIGQVVSRTDHTPLEAVNVWFKNTDIGTQTNGEGYFMLRASSPQQAVMASSVGYKQTVVRLDRNLRDQMVTIQLEEQVNLLEAVIVSPQENQALPILRRVRENRPVNNPELLSGFDNLRERQTRLFLSNIPQKSLQRRIFKELQQGIVPQTDSTGLLPIYLNHTLFSESHQQGAVLQQAIETKVNVVHLMPQQQVTQLVTGYLPVINFYRNYVTVLQKNFISPLANHGTLYYDYFLIDSLYQDSVKLYRIRFRPKNDKNLAFKGTLWIDAEHYALTRIEAAMPPAANINFLKHLHLVQDFAKVDSVRYFYKQTAHGLGFDFHFQADSSRHYTQAILDERNTCSAFRLAADTLQTVVDAQLHVDAAERQFSAAIDSLNNTRLQRIAHTLVDLWMYGYVHTWKLDIGPVVELLRYNRLEGFRPTLSLRTGQRLNEHFTVGGYGGYGVGDRRWKYGGELQYRFGRKRSHLLGMFYDNDVMRYGYQDALLLNDNIVRNSENLLTSFSLSQHYDGLIYREQILLRHRYERQGLRLTTDMEAARLLPSRLVTFERSGGVPLTSVFTATATVGVRMSFGQRSIDHFFHRYYLGTDRPVLNCQLTAGYYQAGEKMSPYGKLKITVKQSLPLWRGRMDYAIEGGLIAGNLPYLLLDMPCAARGLWYNTYHFDLLNQAEFMSDAYIALYWRYYTNGLIFNQIPWIKQFNLREVLLFSMAYGALRDGHRAVMDMPRQGNLQQPYIEAGIGITNILRILTAESVWRLTHRYDTDAIKWGVRLRFRLDF